MIGVNEKVNIREFRYPDDYKEVHQLWASAGEGIHLRRSDEPEEIEKKIRRDPDLFLVAENRGTIVGTVMGGFDGRRGLVYHLAVAEPYREQGIGSLLMTELEQRLCAKGCLRCYLLVTQDNETTIRFYEHRDWEKMELYVYGKDLG